MTGFIKLLNSPQGYYSLLIFVLIVLLSLFFGLYKPAAADNFENLVEHFGDLPPILPEEAYAEICGEGTKVENGLCVQSDEVLVKVLADNDYITINSEGNPVFSPYGKNTTTYTEQGIPEPVWFNKWIERGGFGCGKTIAFGPANGYCDATCRCMDCAGWRGGNITTCDQNNINRASHSRVWCDTEVDPDRCKCADGMCPVNGICVSPFINKNNPVASIDSGELPPCPGCIYTEPLTQSEIDSGVDEDIVGGCAGKFLCEDVDSSPYIENIIELPGNVVTCDIELTKSSKIINTKCSVNEQTGALESTDEENCWHSDHIDPMRQQPYIYFSTTEDNDWTDFCEITPIAETHNGMNEYDCAQQSMTWGMTQQETSQTCLPKIYRWYPVFVDGIGGQTKSFQGYYQTKELMQYQSVDTPPLKSCGKNKCYKELDYGGGNIDYGDCEGCDECGVDLDEDNPNVWDFGCEKCELCKLYVPDGENDGNIVLNCEDMVGGTGCGRVILDIGYPLYGGDKYTCESADGPENPGSNCKEPTRDPFIIDKNIVTWNTGASTNYNNEYNIGYNPSNTPNGDVCGVASNTWFGPNQTNCGNYGTYNGISLNGYSDGGWFGTIQCHS
jgi:hypothetical protein